MTENIVLSCSKLCKSFATKNVLKDISFEIYSGESVALVGANGAGKSTLIKILLGLVKSTKGDIRLFDKDISTPQLRQRIGYLPEIPGYWPELSAYELLEYMGRLRQLPIAEIKKRQVKILAALGLKERGHQRMSGYSKGMLQRSGLAQALLHNPDFLILDEPMSGLDPRAQEKLKIILKELSKSGKTLLISSHSLEDVKNLCSRVIVLEKSYLKDDGPTAEVLKSLIERYRNSEPWDEDQLGEWHDIF